eukprot:2702338-Amphidinium_carterae.1
MCARNAHPNHATEPLTNSHLCAAKSVTLRSYTRLCETTALACDTVPTIAEASYASLVVLRACARQEAKCPNVGECWSSGSATVMIMGAMSTPAPSPKHHSGPDLISTDGTAQTKDNHDTKNGWRLGS